MPDIVYSYDGVPTIREFSKSDKFIRGLMGPFGSGKSSGCVVELIKIADAQKPQLDGKRRARFAVIRNTYPQLKDTTIKTFHDWVPPHAFGDWNQTDHVYRITKLAPDLEIEVLFRALDRPEHVSNLLSLELTAAWVNEAREVVWQVIQALQARVGRYPAVKDGGCVRPGIICDTNPPDTESWWYKLFEEMRPDNAALFRQPSGRAPNAENLDKLPANYYQNLLSTFDEDQIKVYVDGEYGYLQEGKPVYPEYVDSLHCKEVEPVPGVEVWRGWDFGLTPACVWTQVLPDGRWLIFDELVADNLDIYSFADAVLEKQAAMWSGLKQPYDIGDPAGQARSPIAKPKEEQTCFQVLHGKRIYVEAGEQTLTARLGSVRRMLKLLMGGKPRLVLNPRCRVLRKGFQGRYQYRKMQISGLDNRYHEEPDKNEWSHPHDAVQYIGARLFGHLLKVEEESLRPVKPLKYSSKGIV